MTTSGTYSFTVNRDQIIRMAMLSIGKIDEIETPTAQETSDCSMFLNMLVKQWQGTADFAPGLKTFTRRHGHLFLSSTTGAYTVGPNATGWTTSYVSTNTSAVANAGQPVVSVVSTTGILAGDKFGVELSTGNLYWGVVQTVGASSVTLTVNLPSSAPSGAVVFNYTTTATQPVVLETAFLRDIDNSDTPLKIMTSKEYDFLPSKTDPQFISDPTAIYYENLLTNSTVYTDCAASNDVTKHICITYLEAVQDITNPNDTTCYPQEWFLALVWGLAEQIAPMFNAPWTENRAKNAARALAIAQKKEPERVAMYFEPGGDL